MKKLLLFTAAAATGLITYLIASKKHYNPNRNEKPQLNPHPGDHHLTNVFAKAKKYAAS